MGRSLGYHDSDELDRPELNKCPDCECYFASEDLPRGISGWQPRQGQASQETREFFGACAVYRLVP